jgi:hypothetical protein
MWNRIREKDTVRNARPIPYVPVLFLPVSYNRGGFMKFDDKNMMIDEVEPEEPSFDDTIRYCPDCGQPNQFGEICPSCMRDRQIEAMDAR